MSSEDAKSQSQQPKPNSKSQQPSKKKKKNAPDRQQPEWMFPPDESNPVLNPKQKAADELLKDKEEWDAAIKFLKYRAHTAPVRTPPPKQLLTLVGAFLTAYGFNNTCRIYQLQCSSRQRLDGWDSALGEKLPKDLPDLVKIYKEWLKVYEEKKQMDETSSSDTDDSVATQKRKTASKKRKAKAAKEATYEASSSDSESEADYVTKTPIPQSSSSSSESDVEADDESGKLGIIGVPGMTEKQKRRLTNAVEETASSSSDSDTHSDSEDEPAPKKATQAQKAALKQDIAQPSKTSEAKANAAAKSVDGMHPEESASSSDSDSSSSSSSNKSSDHANATTSQSKKVTHAPNKFDDSVSSEESDDEDSSSASSENDFPIPVLKKTKQALGTSKPSSDSSVTLVPPTPIVASAPPKAATRSSSSSSSSSSDTSDSSPPSKPTHKSSKSSSSKRKRSPSPVPAISSPPSKKSKSKSKSNAEPQPSSSQPSDPTPTPNTKYKNQPFTRIPPTTTVDPRLSSNAYKPYDYAERAHQDLSVTKGKGFTKEKNKKKRGSYRGGVIDVGGGKGVKFDD